MSRDLTTAVSSALSNSVIEPFFAVDLLFDSPNELYFWTGLGNIVINSKTYLGAGEVMNISEIQETTEVAARGATVTFSGVPTTLISRALTEPYQGRVCNIYFGVRNNPSAYVEVFSGFIDQMNVSEGAQLGTIEMMVENRLIDLERPRPRKYTSAFQKSQYPSDKGLDHIAAIQDQRLPWGQGVD